jgi:hypothetical protein
MRFAYWAQTALYGELSTKSMHGLHELRRNVYNAKLLSPEADSLALMVNTWGHP